MEKIKFMRLWDLYQKLLTPKQREITDLYFNFDLTVSEIAEHIGITRQGVSECLKTCENQLADYESRLGFAGLIDEADLHISFLKTDAARWAENFRVVHPEFGVEIDELIKITEKDYSVEIQTALNKEKVK